MKPVKSNKNASSFPTLLSDFFNTDNFFSNRWMERAQDHSIPAVNIRQKDEEYLIDMAAPGFGKNDFTINVEDNILSVSAQKEEEKKEEKGQFTRKEFSYNSFSRSFTLPQGASADKIDAKYSDGILKLKIPKKEAAKKVSRKEIKIA